MTSSYINGCIAKGHCHWGEEKKREFLFWWLIKKLRKDFNVKFNSTRDLFVIIDKTYNSFK